jgi:ligand-binding SRPBCC domain-containing protein
MKVYTLRREQLLPRTLDEVFSFFERPENLEAITPPWLHFKMITPTPVHIKQGSIFDYTMRVRGISMHWASLVTEYNPPHSFVDQQIRGPYEYWYNTHRFKETDEGTHIIEEIRYIMPFGLLGRAVHGLMVAQDLQEIFDYRQMAIEKLFLTCPKASTPRYEYSLQG